MSDEKEFEHDAVVIDSEDKIDKDEKLFGKLGAMNAKSFKDALQKLVQYAKLIEEEESSKLKTFEEVLSDAGDYILKEEDEVSDKTGD